MPWYQVKEVWFLLLRISELCEHDRRVTQMFMCNPNVYGSEITNYHNEESSQDVLGAQRGSIYFYLQG